MASEQFSLCWDNFHKNMSSGMNSLLESEDLVDVTLAVQGKCLKAHKMVLSVCSPYFKELFKSNPCQHPIVFMKDVSYEALSDLLQFMYQGEVQVSQENLTTFIKTAEALQIKGLTGDGNGSTDNEVTEVVPEKHSVQVEEYKPTPRPKKQPQPLPAPMSSPSVKRQRLSMSSNDSQPLPPSLPPQPITKTEPIALPQPVNIPSEPAAVHFKMEPYDSTQNLIDESGDDNFGEDTLDETVGDDTEDYSMMEGGTGEEEPQAGTSADGAGEGQVLVYKNFEEGSKKRIVLNGYEFEEEVNDINPVPWICVRRHFSCTARFYERTDNVFEITTPIKHNHAPTYEDNLDLLSVSIVDIKRRSKIDSVIILADSDLDEDTEDEDDTEDDSEEDTDEEEPSPYPIRPIPGKENKGNTEEEEESKKKEAKQRPSRPSRPSPYPIRPIPEKVVEDDTEEERKKKKARQRPSRPSPYPIRPLPEKEDEDDTKEKEERKKKETKQRPSRPSRPSPYSIPDKKTLLKNGNMKSRRSLLKKQPPNFDESLLELKKVTTIRKKRLH